MVLHIAKRELYDHFNSLRFAFTVLLFLALMIANAIGHFGEYNARLTEYRTKVITSLDTMKGHTDSLFSLMLNGPGQLYKKPSVLIFCADGGERFLPEYVEASNYGWWRSWQAPGEKPITIRNIWHLRYPQSNPNLWDITPDYTNISWAAIISLVLPFIAILFTFDAIAGEREQGTLRLTLSNSVARDLVLVGKFLGAFLSIGIPFVIAVLINLFLLYTAGGVPLDANEWGRLGLILLVALIYLSIFIALGLLVSSRANRSSVSLTILLLIWVVWVILTPSTLGSIVSGLQPTKTIEELDSYRYQQRENLNAQYPLGKGEGPTRTIPATEMTLLWAEYVRKEAQLNEQLHQEHLTDQIAQVNRARTITRISPASIVQYTIESLAGTGFSHHLSFLEAVHRYASEFRQFLLDTDRADPKSSHAPYVPEGASELPVPYSEIPKFEDSDRVSTDFNAALMDILLLVLFFVVLFALAYLSFLRVDVL